MKVSAVNFYSVNRYKSDYNKVSGTSNSQNSGVNIDDLKGMPFVYPVSFTSIQNSSKLRALFAYDLPCMYTGIPMIDPKVLTKFIKAQVFNRPSSQLLQILKPYKDRFVGMEARVFNLITERANVHPEKNIQELLQELEPVYKRRLRKKQAPIFRELHELALTLPAKYQYKFKQLMIDTNKKLDEKPVIIPFSSYEFKYKLAKIKEDVLKLDNTKAKKVMNKLLKESKKFSNTTNANTIEHQKKVVDFMELILKKSVLKDNESLKNLIEISKSRLTKEEIVVPFSRKNFIYDIAKLIEDLPDKNLQEKFITIAQKLPTSQESMSAYILKLSAEPAEKIGHRLLWPYLASVEHIFPRSCGGKDLMENFGGATTKANSNRKSIDFVAHMKQHPEVRENCQKYVDRLIELYHNGIFRKLNVNPKYIVDFKKTILNQSKGLLDLDISKLYSKKLID